MSRLTPSLLALDKGLDLQTAKILAQEGSISDMLNYEQVDFQGQKRIDGFTRYDGSPLSAIDEFILVGAPTLVNYPPYQLAFNSDDELYGVYVGEYSGLTALAVLDFNRVPPSAVNGSSSGMTTQEHYESLLSYNEYLRGLVEDLPGAIIGLHWFKDRLFAVVDIENYTPDDGRIDILGNASLFESRSVQQVLEEDGPSGPYDFGWRFVHQGWEVLFQDGRVLYGDLVAKNQNRQDIGIQGPTSIAGDSGSPLILLQKIAITNGNVQVNGWKSTDTPTTYILDPRDVTSTDDTYIYADAFIEWDGETGVVSAPGANGVGLVEYSPTNTIEVNI